MQSIKPQLDIITWQQYSKHITPTDCWILIDGIIYNVSDYLVEHPGGDDILLKYSGIDASIPFNQQNHSKYAKSLRDARKVGKIQSPTYTQEYRLMLQQKKRKLKQEKKRKQRLANASKIPKIYTLEQVSSHKYSQDCWIVIENNVYDVTTYMSTHPGGEGVILQKGGKDATLAFKQANHSIDAIDKKKQFLIGTIQKKQIKISNLVLGVLILILILIGGWFVLRQ